MAVPANTTKTTDEVGLREDLSGIIHRLLPNDTPLQSHIAGTRSATQPIFDWLKHGLDPGDPDNAHAEGDDTAADAHDPHERLINYCEIVKKGITISGTAMKSVHADTKMPKSYEFLRKMNAIKLDFEASLMANRVKFAGDGTTANPRRTGSLITFVSENTQGGIGSTESDGKGSRARVDAPSNARVLFTETQVQTAMQQIWNKGATAQTLLAPPDLISVAAYFNGALERRDKASESKVSAVIRVYETNFGMVKLMASRQIRQTDVFIFAPKQVAIANLRPLKMKQKEKTGDADKYQLVMECGLEVGNEGGIALISDLKAK